MDKLSNESALLWIMSSIEGLPWPISKTRRTSVVDLDSYLNKKYPEMSSIKVMYDGEVELEDENKS